MSVIAKMSVSSIKPYPESRAVAMHCVYDNILSNEENEDVRFTKATPSGQAEFTVGNPLDISLGEGFYLLFHPMADKPDFDGCELAGLARCHSITDFGGTSRTVEICSAYNESDEVPAEKRISQGRVAFNIKLAIDNPGASLQFQAGSSYWLSVYRTDKPLHEVIALARGPVNNAEAAKEMAEA